MYIGGSAVGLLINAALQTEGEVVAADHYPPAKSLLKRLHLWLNTGKVQPLGIREETRRFIRQRLDPCELRKPNIQRILFTWVSGSRQNSFCLLSFLFILFSWSVSLEN